jgi:hypothetical protein
MTSLQQVLDDLAHLSRAAAWLAERKSVPRDARALGSSPSRDERFRALIAYFGQDLPDIADRQRLVGRTSPGPGSQYLNYRLPDGKVVVLWLPAAVSQYIETGR